MAVENDECKPLTNVVLESCTKDDALLYWYLIGESPYTIVPECDKDLVVYVQTASLNNLALQKQSNDPSGRQYYIGRIDD